jgi:hypothetical protein
MSRPPSSSLAVWLLGAALVVWLLPIGLRDYIGESIRYLTRAEWWPFIYPYFTWALFWRHCTWRILLVEEWLKITVVPTLLMFFITRHNGALDYRRYYSPSPQAESSWLVRLFWWLIDLPGSIVLALLSPLAAFRRLLTKGWCGGRSCNDRLIKGVCIFGITVTIFTAYWAAVNYIANNGAEDDPVNEFAGTIERGLQSQSQRNWSDPFLFLRVARPLSPDVFARASKLIRACFRVSLFSFLLSGTTTICPSVGCTF